MRRAGFTLLELLVAIVLTGVVALLAYGTARAGIDLNERIARERSRVEAQMIVRSLLHDALRHLPEGGGASMDDTLFTIADRFAADGLPSDIVRFVSHGVTPPFGASAMWSVTLLPTEDGIRLLAFAIGADRMAPIDAQLTGVRGLNVRVLARSADSTWLEQWESVGRVPAAVALEFLSERGTVVAPPLVVHAALDIVR
jgi:prepilin-type N-terminal cleavage/methylation domain-containing protein